MVQVSSRYDTGDRRPLGVSVDVTESGDDTDWDETGSPTQHPTQTEDAHDASAVSYDNTGSGLTADDVQEAIDELASGLVANAELNHEGGQSLIDNNGFPNAGATGDYDPTDGNVFTRTLNANHVGTILAPVGSGAATLEWWIATGAGGFTFELEADGGTVSGDLSDHPTAAGETFRVLGDRVPGTTNDWRVDLLGGGVAASGRWELAVITGSPPDPLYADGDFLYIFVP